MTRKEKVIIKKYQNRRLYDVGQKRYITLDELTERIREGAEVEIIDSKTGEDITQQVLIQIILDNQRASGFDLFTNEFLHHLIQYRDQSTADFFQRYLPNLLQNYMDWQRQTQSQFMQWAQLGWQSNPFNPQEIFTPGFGMWGMPGRYESKPESPYKSSQSARDRESVPADGERKAPAESEDVDALKMRVAELEGLLKKSRKKD